MNDRTKTGGNNHEEIFQRERSTAHIEHGTFQRVTARRIGILLRSRQNLLNFALEILAKEAHIMKKNFKDSVLAVSTGIFACSLAVGLAVVYALDKFI